MQEHILITGANRGIGLELAKQYLERGAHVFATCRNPGRASALHALSAAFPHTLLVIEMEVTYADQIASAVRHIRKATQSLNILYNNAAINPPGQALGQITTETMLDVFNVNAVAPLMITRACLDLLRAGDNPRVINISSDMASLAGRDYGDDYAYCASKAALNMNTRGMAVDLRPYGITCVALDPGWVRTDMGGPRAQLSPEESAAGILSVVDRLKLPMSGSYLRWNGETLPW